jgi:hypothetical protein
MPNQRLVTPSLLSVVDAHLLQEAVPPTLQLVVQHRLSHVTKHSKDSGIAVPLVSCATGQRLS